MIEGVLKALSDIHIQKEIKFYTGVKPKNNKFKARLPRCVYLLIE
jgi:hypothetical protein